MRDNASNLVIACIPIKSYLQQIYHMHESPHIPNNCTCTPCLNEMLGLDRAKSCIFEMVDSRDAMSPQERFCLDFLPCDNPRNR